MPLMNQLPPGSGKVSSEDSNALSVRRLGSPRTLLDFCDVYVRSGTYFLVHR